MPAAPPAFTVHRLAPGPVVRFAAVGFTFAASAAYLAVVPARLATAAVVTAVAAWTSLFVVAGLVTPPRLRGPRFDWLLRTVTVGSAVMAVALALAPLAGPVPAAYAGLALGDVAMTFTLVTTAPAAGVTRPRAAAVWAAMNLFLAAGILIGAGGVLP